MLALTRSTQTFLAKVTISTVVWLMLFIAVAVFKFWG
jgi:hypothetical protein